MSDIDKDTYSQLSDKRPAAGLKQTRASTPLPALTRALTVLSFVTVDLVLGLLSLASVLLSPLHVGRLLRTVSIPRLREHRARSTLTVLGVGLGVAVLVAVSITSDSVTRGVNATIDNVAGKADLQVSSPSTAGFAESLLDRVHAVDGVYKASPVVQQTATVANPGAQGERVLIVGVDLLGTEDAYFRNYASDELDAIRKDSLNFLNSTTNVLVSREFAARMHLKLHDKLLLGTPQGVQAFDVWGFVDSQGVGRAFGGSVAVMYYPALQEAFGRGPYLDHIDLAVTPGQDLGAVAKRLEEALGDSVDVERPSLRNQRVSNMLRAVNVSMSFSTLIALTAGGFLVFNTMTISIVQRRRELATLQALGTTRGQLAKLLTWEGLLIGVVGSAFGVGMGVGLSHLLLNFTARALNKVYLQQTISEVHVSWPVLIASFVAGVVVTTIAAAVPAMSAASLKVAQVLRAGSVSTTQSRRGPNKADVVSLVLVITAYFAMQLPPIGGLPLGALGACGMLLVVGRLLLPRVVLAVHHIVALLLMRANVHARLANDNLPRDLGRTSGTATGLMAGAALMVGFATFDNSFLTSLYTWSGQSVPGDLFITSGRQRHELAQRSAGTRARATAGDHPGRRSRATDPHGVLRLSKLSHQTNLHGHQAVAALLQV
jgi:putative ABC transport system permease protein